MIFLILILAAFLRFYLLSGLPISLFGDEIDVGYHAWSLITTGRDYMGHLLPTYIQSLAEWRAPLLMYVVAPFVGLLGPSAFSVRLPIALLGLTNIYLIFVLVKKLFNNKFLSLISALILTLTPWHIQYSRAAFESTLFLTLLLLGVIFFLRQQFLISGLSFVLTFYTYSVANIFTPLLILILYLIYRPKLNLKKNLLTIIICALVLTPFIFSLFSGQSGSRFSGISIFADHKLVEEVIIARTQAWVKPSFIETIFHNKPIIYLTTFIQNYLASFSTQFLFIQGDPNARHSVGQFGELLQIFLPFLLMGIFACFNDLKQKENKLILVWLFLSPIASSLTQDGGMHATRLFIMVIPLTILTALGFKFALDFFTSPKMRIGFILLTSTLLIINLGLYWHRYAIHYRFDSARAWQYGYEDIFNQLKPYLSQSKNIYINSTYEPTLLRFAFYTQFPPQDFQKGLIENTYNDNLTPYFSGTKLGDHLYFGQRKDRVNYQDFLKTNDLYIAAQGKEFVGTLSIPQTLSPDSKILGLTNDFYGYPLFYLIGAAQ